MIENQGVALQTVLGYYEAYANEDLEQAMNFIADDIVCNAPAGRIEGALAFQGFLKSFFQLLDGAELIASFGDHGTAFLPYDHETNPALGAPAAGYFTVEEGKITRILLICDRGAYETAAYETGAGAPPPTVLR